MVKLRKRSQTDLSQNRNVFDFSLSRKRCIISSDDSDEEEVDADDDVNDVDVVDDVDDVDKEVDVDDDDGGDEYSNVQTCPLLARCH